MLRWVPVLLLCVGFGIVLAGCPSGAVPVNNPATADETGAGGGGGSGNVRVNLTLAGLSGTETNLAANVYIGDFAVSRGNTGGLAVQPCRSLTENPQLCSFGGQPGQVATIIAIEDAGGLTPITANSPPQSVPTSAVEFVNFSQGCDSIPEPGVCVVTLNSSRDVTANWTRMHSVLLQQVGAGGISVSLQAPPPLTVPPVAANPAIPATLAPLGPACFSPNPNSIFLVWLPLGSTVTFTANPVLQGPLFRGWTGACAGAGTGPTCTLQIGGADLTAGARFQYFNCTNLFNEPCSITSLDPSCVLTEP